MMAGQTCRITREASSVRACSGKTAKAGPSSAPWASPPRTARAAPRAPARRTRAASRTWKRSTHCGSTAGSSAEPCWPDAMCSRRAGQPPRQRHDHQFGDILERDRHDTLFGEAAIRGAAGRTPGWPGRRSSGTPIPPRDVPRFDYAFTIPGVFVQDDVELTSWWSGSASARVDAHSEYGWFVSPRISSLMRGGDWTGTRVVRHRLFRAECAHRRDRGRRFDEAPDAAGARGRTRPSPCRST